MCNVFGTKAGVLSKGEDVVGIDLMTVMAFVEHRRSKQYKKRVIHIIVICFRRMIEQFAPVARLAFVS